MKRLTTFALVSLVALLATGLAIAHNKAAGKTEPVAATFAAAPTSASKSVQCTGTDGTYEITRGVYEGTATGDPRLTGKITIKTKSVVNLTNGYGWTKGSVKLRDATTGETKAKAELVAVNSQRGVLNGLLSGRVKDGGPLLANFTATFNAAGTSLTGELGTGTGQNTAILANGCSNENEHGDDKRDGDKKDSH